ncbi:unnamed protein product [Arctogadus glacialis]
MEREVGGVEMKREVGGVEMEREVGGVEMKREVGGVEMNDESGQEGRSASRTLVAGGGEVGPLVRQDPRARSDHPGRTSSPPPLEGVRCAVLHTSDPTAVSCPPSRPLSRGFRCRESFLDAENDMLGVRAKKGREDGGQDTEQ